MRSDSVQQAANTPDHVRHGAVNHDGPQGKKYGHGTELHPLGERAGDQRRRNDREHELVNHVGLFGDGRGIVGIRIQLNASQKQVLKSADKRVAVTERQRIAANRPDHADQHHHREALHHGAQDVLPSHQPAIKQRQTGACH